MDTVTLRRANVHICQSRDEFAAEVAREFAALSAEAISDHGYFSVALSGGHTPPILYARLLQDDYLKAIAWNKIHFFVGDERCVPADSTDSNFGAANRLFLSKLPLPAENLHCTTEQDSDPIKSAKLYEMEIQHFFAEAGQKDGLPRFDLILLGMGPEGHIASLFPGTKALAETKRLVTENLVEKLKATRITFTYPLINNATNVILMIEGPEKSEAVAEALESPAASAPVSAVCPTNGKLQWFIDQSAARDLCSLPRS